MAKRADLIVPSLVSTDADNEQDGERSAEEIRQHIAATRESITETVDELSDRVQRTFDWREQVANYPWAAVGVAAGLGFLLSGLFKRRRSPRDRMVAALADTVEEMGGRFRAQLDDAGLGRRSGWSTTIKAAATGAVTKAATDYLRNRLAEHGVLRPNADDHVASVAAQQEGRAPRAEMAARF